MLDIEMVLEVQDSRYAAALILVGHKMRDPDPCIWFTLEGKEVGIFFFPSNQKCDLSAEDVLSICAHPVATYKEAKRLLLSPDSDESERIKQIDVITVCGWIVGSNQYKKHVIRELNASKKRSGFHVQTRGDKIATIGANMPDAAVAELKEMAGF